MIRMYCHNQHYAKGLLCEDCQELLDYARERLEKCPFREGKPTCAKCPVHCYTPIMRGRVRAVMRYAGPRMAYRHPLLTALHFLDGRTENTAVKELLEAKNYPRKSAGRYETCLRLFLSTRDCGSKPWMRMRRSSHTTTYSYTGSPMTIILEAAQ